MSTLLRPLTCAGLLMCAACVPWAGDFTTIMVPMRDGVALATELHFPDAEQEPYAVVLMRTPYGTRLLTEYADFYTRQGYAVALQDVRGRFESQGQWEPFVHEGEDGFDTIEWLAAQEWCNGKVGMVGASYSGSAQLAAAVLHPPHLAAIIPNVAPAMPFDNAPYENGALLLGWALRWADTVENARTGAELQEKLQAAIRRDWYEPMLELPVIDLDRKIIGKEVPYWRDWVRHEPGDTYWEPMEYLDGLLSVDVPVFLQSGWFDGGNRGTRLAYEALRRGSNGRVRMVVGPWPHGDRSTRNVGGSDLGPAAALDLFDQYRRWFDVWLRDGTDDIVGEPPVQLFLMGDNRWLYADRYPLPGTDFRSYYLAPAEAETPGSLGSLTPVAPAVRSAFDSYDYDPARPTPSFYAHLKRRSLQKYVRDSELRDDVVSYQTPALDEALHIAGPVSLVLHASTSATDTDWVATLYGLDTEGRPYPVGLTFGIVRARFRDSRGSPRPLESGEIERYVIDLGQTAITIPSGHRLRLEIASASFPEHSRNLNTGGHNETGTEYVVASQRVHRSEGSPSHLVLPVIDPASFQN